MGGSSCARAVDDSRQACSWLRRLLGTCLGRRLLSDSRSAGLVCDWLQLRGFPPTGDVLIGVAVFWQRSRDPVL